MRALIVAAMLLLAAPAWGATYHVRQTALGDGSGSSNANSMAIATFNALGTGGNVALLHGNFTTVPNPATAGTMASPTTYRNGATNNSRDSVSFGTPGSNIDFYLPGTGTARHVLYRDFTVRGRVYIGTSQAAVTMSRIRMSNIRIIDGYFLNYRIDDCKFDSLNLTIPASTAYPHGSTVDFGRADKGVDSVWYSSRDTLSNSTFNNAGAATQTVEGGLAAAYVFAGRNMVYESLRCSLTTTNSYIAGTPLRFSRVCQTQGGRMTNCFFYGYWTQGGAGVDEPMNWVFKDGVRFFTVDRCTVLVAGDGHLSGNAGYPYIDFAQDEGDGTAAQACESIGGNTITNSYFSNQTQSVNPIRWYTNATDGDYIAYNTFVSGRYGGADVHSYAKGNGNAVDRVSPDGTVFDHNTFITYCPSAYALTLNGSSLAAEQAITWTNNIFCNPYLSNADTSAVRAVHFGRTSTWGSRAVGPVGNDYNLTATPNATTRRQIQWSAGTWQMGLDGGWTTTRSPLTLDFNSRHTRQPFDSTFTDTALATFSGIPTRYSAALFGPDGFVGAVPAPGHTIIASAGTGGSISPNGNVHVDDGASQEFNMNPASGYYLSSVTVDGSAATVASPYTFTNITDNHTIAAGFTANDHTITVTYSAGGSVGFDGATIPSGGELNIADGRDDLGMTITADPGYAISDVLVDGVSVGSSSSYMFDPVVADHTLHATFARITYTFTASAGAHGSIDPPGVSVLEEGWDIAYSITADPGYHITDVLVDGVSMGAVSGYQSQAVYENHTISATFAINTYAITSSAVGGGSVYPNGVNSYNYGATQKYSFVPTSGSYQLLGVTVDGVSVGADSTYTFTGIAATHTVVATFGAASTITITATSSAHGIINPGTTSVSSGASQTFTMWPGIGYAVSGVLVDGSSVGAVYSYTFTNVTAPHTIYATFAATELPKEARESTGRPPFPLVVKNAGTGRQGAAVAPQTYPMVTAAGVTNNAAIAILAEQPMVILQIAAADSLLPTAGENSQTVFLKAMRDLRKLRPDIAIVGMNNLDAGWLGGITSRDTTAKYRILADHWFAGRNVGWAAGVPMGQTTFPAAGQDTTGSNGFLWNKTLGWKSAYFQTRSYGSPAGSPGSTNCNLNLAYRSGSDWPVRDSLIATYIRQMERVDPITGDYVWDGFYVDLALPYAYPFSGDTVDWVRAGYPGTTSANFDTAWFNASSVFFKRLREHADSLGRTNFILKANAAMGYAFGSLDGYTIEDWPNNNTVSAVPSEKWRDNWISVTQHRSRSSNYEMVTGLQSHGLKYRQSWPASMIALSPNPATDDSASTSVPGASNDTLLAYRKAITLGLATACLANHWMHVPSATSPRLNWWFDEYGVNRTSGLATRAITYTGWLGYPTDHWYNNTSKINTTDLLGTSGLFDSAGDRAEWTLGSNAYGAATFDSDTSMSGSSLRLQTLKCYPTHLDYSYTAQSKVKWRHAIGDTITVSFWARANYERPIWIALQGRDGNDDGTWGHVWLGTNWQPYRVSSVATDTMTVDLEFWAGDTTGIVWVDSVKCQTGRFRGGSYLRQFDNGFVIVNPTAHADTVLAPFKAKRITSRIAPNYNNGVSYDASTGIPVPAGEALFLLKNETAAAGSATTTNGNRDDTTSRARGRGR
jgi:hypothetical protein